MLVVRYVQLTGPLWNWAAAARTRRFPRRHRVALKLRSLACSWRTSELEHASLRAGVRVELQSVVVSPVNVETAGHTHQRRWTIRPALVWLCLRLGEVPRVSNLPRLSTERQHAVVALGWNQHPQVPMLGDDRHPIPREIFRGRRASRRRRARRSAATASCPCPCAVQRRAPPRAQSQVQAPSPVESYRVASRYLRRL